MLCKNYANPGLFATIAMHRLLTLVPRFNKACIKGIRKCNVFYYLCSPKSEWGCKQIK